MGKLGDDVPFTALGACSSTDFVPAKPGLRLSLKATPSRAGSLRAWMFDTELGFAASGEEIGSGAVSALANRANIIPIEGAYYGLRVGFRLVFTDTSNNSGTCSFAGSEG